MLGVAHVGHAAVRHRARPRCIGVARLVECNGLAKFCQVLLHRLTQRGYQIKTVAKPDATLIAAKKGAANKLGYIFAHSAIIIVLLGGMLDSDLAIKFQQWFMGKVPFEGNGLISQISNERVARPQDVLTEGQMVKVKLMGFDDRGKTKLSMKVVDQTTGEDLSKKETADAAE